MNKISKDFLLTSDKCMLKIHLKHPEFAYNACGPFTKHSKRIEKFRKRGNLKYLYGNELDKAYFAHDLA